MPKYKKVVTETKVYPKRGPTWLKCAQGHQARLPTEDESMFECIYGHAVKCPKTETKRTVTYVEE